MTCIVALRTATSIAVAGDGLLTAGDCIISHTAKKYVELPNGWVIANSGLSSFAGLLGQGKEKLFTTGDVYSLCASIRVYLKEVGYAANPDVKVGLPGYDLGLVILNKGVEYVQCPESPAYSGADRWAKLPGLWVASGGDIWPKEVEVGRPYGIGSGGNQGEAGAWVAIRHGLPALRAAIQGVQAAIEYDLTSGGEIWSMEIAL